MQQHVFMKRCAGAVAAVAALAGSALAGGPFPPGPGPWGPDITICQLYGLAQRPSTSSPYARVGDIVGLGMATTSWNVGTVNARWEQVPASVHPMIWQNLFRFEKGQMRQVGQAWIKHGFFALSNLQCGSHPYTGSGCAGTNGSSLGVGCTDTYSTSLNMGQSGLGPRYEINPWTGGWQNTGSVFAVGGVPNTSITRRLQVKDADLADGVNNNSNAVYIAEAGYIAVDDVDMMNSAGWKIIDPIGVTGGNYSFTMSGSTTDENSGYAVDYWASQGARLTMVAQSLPIVENWTATNSPRGGGPAPGGESPDGRAIVVSSVTSLPGGMYRYEYAVLNIDMDRQIRSFTVPIPDGVSVSNSGFYAVFHHNEPYCYSFHNGSTRVNGPVVNNDPWTFAAATGNVSWSTNAHQASPPYTVPSNPIRWGTMYNFWFETNRAPVDGSVSLGLFKPGAVMSVSGVTNVPSAPPPPPFCPGDANGDGTVDFSDITSVLGNYGASYTPGSAGQGDANNDGVVDFGDITAVLGNFGVPCV